MKKLRIITFCSPFGHKHYYLQEKISFIFWYEWHHVARFNTLKAAEEAYSYHGKEVRS